MRTLRLACHGEVAIEHIVYNCVCRYFGIVECVRACVRVWTNRNGDVVVDTWCISCTACGW